MKKKSKDENEVAFGIVQQATQSKTPSSKTLISQIMTEMGRKGGLKGGKARAKSLTPEQRQEIAKKAAETRWKNHKKQ
jgi:hypothetical protein